MISVAARSLGTWPSTMRPTSPYWCRHLPIPPLRRWLASWPWQHGVPLPGSVADRTARRRHLCQAGCGFGQWVQAASPAAGECSELGVDSARQWLASSCHRCSMRYVMVSRWADVAEAKLWMATGGTYVPVDLEGRLDDVGTISPFDHECERAFWCDAGVCRLTPV